MKRLIMIVVACSGCVNTTGGGTVHSPPAYIRAGDAFEVQFECVSINGGPAVRRFSKLTLCHRLSGEKEYQCSPMKCIKDAGDKAVFSADLPEFPSGVSVEYYVSFEFAGQKLQRYWPPVSVVQEADGIEQR